MLAVKIAHVWMCPGQSRRPVSACQFGHASFGFCFTVSVSSAVLGGECRIAFGFPGKKFIDRVHDLICYRRIFHHFKFQLRRSAQQFADFIFIFHARQLDNNAFPSLLLNGRLGNTVLVYTVADNSMARSTPLSDSSPDS